jgi:hypothetical protein
MSLAVVKPKSSTSANTARVASVKAAAAKSPANPVRSSPATVAASVAAVPKPPTVKQKVVAFLTENQVSFAKNSTLNSLVEKFYAVYPEFFQSLRLEPSQPVNLQSKDPIEGFDASLDQGEQPEENGHSSSDESLSPSSAGAASKQDTQTPVAVTAATAKTPKSKAKVDRLAQLEDFLIELSDRLDAIERVKFLESEDGKRRRGSTETFYSDDGTRTVTISYD